MESRYWSHPVPAFLCECRRGEDDLLSQGIDPPGTTDVECRRSLLSGARSADNAVDGHYSRRIRIGKPGHNPGGYGVAYALHLGRLPITAQAGLQELAGTLMALLGNILVRCRHGTGVGGVLLVPRPDFTLALDELFLRLVHRQQVGVARFAAKSGETVGIIVDDRLQGLAGIVGAGGNRLLASAAGQDQPGQGGNDEGRPLRHGSLTVFDVFFQDSGHGNGKMMGAVLHRTWIDSIRV